jgi:hypothetical protein
VIIELMGLAMRAADGITMKASVLIPEGCIPQIPPPKRIVNFGFTHTPVAMVSIQLAHTGRKASTTRNLSSSADRKHLNCVCKRKLMAGQWYFVKKKIILLHCCSQSIRLSVGLLVLSMYIGQRTHRVTDSSPTCKEMTKGDLQYVEMHL